MAEVLARINHYFFPHSSNNQKARILHPSFLSLLVAVFLTSQFFLSYFALFFPRVLGYAANISPERLIELTNQERTKKGLFPLENNSLLNEAARRKAGDMFALDYWAHNSPTGRTPWTFFKEANYSYIFAGENLARDFNDSQTMVTAWMDSPTHRNNILNGEYQEIGIAVVNGTLEGVETTLVVQLFGTPTPTPLVAETPLAAVIPEPVVAGGEATFSAQPPFELLAVSKPKSEDFSPSLLNPFSFTKTLVIFLAGLIIVVLAVDIYLVARKKVVRLSGRSMAHLTFLLFFLLAVFFTQQGLVL